MVRHRIKFSYGGSQDDHSIQLAFSKKFVDQRKEWLTNWMEEGKRRKSKDERNEIDECNSNSP